MDVLILYPLSLLPSLMGCEHTQWTYVWAWHGSCSINTAVEIQFSTHLFHVPAELWHFDLPLKWIRKRQMQAWNDMCVVLFLYVSSLVLRVGWWWFDLLQYHFSSPFPGCLQWFVTTHVTRNFQGKKILQIGDKYDLHGLFAFAVLKDTPPQISWRNFRE